MGLQESAEALAKGVLDIQTQRDLGVVDTTVVGRSEHITRLALCTAHGRPLLEVRVLVKSGVFSQDWGMVYWSIDADHVASLDRDMERCIQALDRPDPAARRPGLMTRIWSSPAGYRLVEDLGPLSMTDGVSTSHGYVGEKRKGGNRFLIVKQRMTRSMQIDSVPLPGPALQAIRTALHNVD